MTNTGRGFDPRRRDRKQRLYEAFATRDLREFDLAYTCLDRVAERLHPGQKKEAVLCAWGIEVEGR